MGVYVPDQCSFRVLKILNCRMRKPINSNLRPTGDLRIRLSVGGSVASARAPSVSMIRLTHKSCTQDHVHHKPELHKFFIDDDFRLCLVSVWELQTYIWSKLSVRDIK